MPTRTALVLSGGGLFGAWQAGAWSQVRKHFRPDLIVGASVGSLNGYLMACGISDEELAARWLTPELARFELLERNIKAMLAHYHPRTPFAVTLTDILHLKPRVFRDQEITWRHLAGSCALPGFLPQQKIGERWYSDGGLLNPLPVWAAVELGATEIVGLHVLAEMPSPVLRTFTGMFRAVAGHNPPLPAGVSLRILKPSRRLGSVRDALSFQHGNIEDWLALGAADVSNL